MARIIVVALALTACGDAGLSEAQRSEATQIAQDVAEESVEDTTDMAYDHETRLAEIEERLGIE